MLTAVEWSAYVALGAIALIAINLVIGLLMAGGYNPVRHWPHRPIKLFTLHNWTAYMALAAALLHPGILLFSSKPRFRIIDVLVPLWSPVQPSANTLGAMALYLVILVVATSYFRRTLGRRLWKTIHYSTYAAAVVVVVHGVIADPSVTGRPVDYLDGEKVFIEGCAVVVAGVAMWRARQRRSRRSAAVRAIAIAPAATAGAGTNIPDQP